MFGFITRAARKCGTSSELPSRTPVKGLPAPHVQPVVFSLGGRGGGIEEPGAPWEGASSEWDLPFAAGHQTMRDTTANNSWEEI